MAVRSKPLASIHGNLTAASLIYTVPAGRTTIVRTTTLVNWSAAVRSFAIMRNGTSAAQRMVGLVDVAANRSIDIEAWRALSPGDTLYVITTGLDCSVFLFGAELNGVAP